LLDALELARAILCNDARAGGETLTPNTFRTQLHTLARVGLASRAAELTALAALEMGTSELVSWRDGGCGKTPGLAALFNTHARASGRSALG